MRKNIPNNNLFSPYNGFYEYCTDTTNILLVIHIIEKQWTVLLKNHRIVLELLDSVLLINAPNNN